MPLPFVAAGLLAYLLARFESGRLATCGLRPGRAVAVGAALLVGGLVGHRRRMRRAG